MVHITVVLPTHVGVIPRVRDVIISEERTTHTRGGDPRLSDRLIERAKYYPHTWG